MQINFIWNINKFTCIPLKQDNVYNINTACIIYLLFFNSSMSSGKNMGAPYPNMKDFFTTFKIV